MSRCPPPSRTLPFKGSYDETGPPVEDADILVHGLPMSVLKALHTGLTKKTVEHDRKMLDGLKRAGFQTDSSPDDAGLLAKYFQRDGNYYIDMGTYQLIAESKFKVKQGQEIDEVLSHGVRFADGTEPESPCHGLSEHGRRHAPCLATTWPIASATCEYSTRRARCRLSGREAAIRASGSTAGTSPFVATFLSSSPCRSRGWKRGCITMERFR